MKYQLFIPIIIIIIYILIKPLININTSILDNIVSIFTVLYYATIDIKYGILACLFFVLYRVMKHPILCGGKEGFNIIVQDNFSDTTDTQDKDFPKKKGKRSKTTKKSKTKIITPENTKLSCINLKKNRDRLVSVKSKYLESDLIALPFNRFDAIYGRDVDINNWLTKSTIKELKDVESRKYRLYHHQLTYGGVGCFLSHYTLALDLTRDLKYDYYIILEDDINIRKDIYEKLNDYVENAPKDWDMLIFGYFRLSSVKMNQQYMKPKGFWGMQGYIINKAGASKFVNDVDYQKIDGQVDSYMSRMQQQGKINIYATEERLVYSNLLGNKTNIQMPLLHVKNIDPFNYKGYKM